MAYQFIPNASGGPPTLRFQTPMDFVDYVRDLDAGKYAAQGLPEADPQTRAQAAEIARNPSGWVMSGGHPRKKDDWLARNLKWIGPAAVGAMAAPAVIGALKGAGAATGAAKTATTATAATRGIPASTYLQASMVPRVAMTTPAAALATRGGRNVLDSLGNVVNTVTDRALGGWQQAALATLAGLPALLATRGMSDEEKALYGQLQQDLAQDRQFRTSQQQRVTLQNPLYEAVTRLAMQRLPGDVQAPIGRLNDV